MTILNTININNNRIRESVDSFFDKMHGFKKSYGRINHLLRWGELLSPPATASFLTQPQKIIKEQLGILTIPGFVGSTFRFSNAISKLVSSNIDKVEKVKRSVIPLLRYTQSCSTLLQYISAIQLLDLKKLSQPLIAIHALARLILSVSAFYTQIQRLQHSFSEIRNEGFLFFKNLLDLYSAIFCLIIFFFSFSASPFWMLTASSLMLVTALVDNLVKFVLD